MRKRKLGLWSSIRMLFRKISGEMLAMGHPRHFAQAATYFAVLAVAERSAGIVW